MRKLAVLSLLLATTLAAAEKPKTGTICIAGFQAQTPPGEPNMTMQTWGPSASSRFAFRIGKDIKRTVAQEEMATITGVPADRKVLIGIRLDGKPFESFWIDLRREPGQRACFWLRPAYWNWINTVWDKAHGCRCK